MATFDSGVNAPGGASFAPQPLNFASFGQWAADDPYKKVFEQQQQQLNQQKINDANRQAAIAQAFPNGLPMKDGQVDYPQMAQQWAKLGAPADAVNLMQQAPAPLSPLLGGQGGASPDLAAQTAKTIQAEGTTKNPKSSAEGVGQFIDSTWIESIKKYFPNLAQGRSDDQILAMRKIPALAARVTEAFTAGNQEGLTKAGLPVTPATTYLAHFAGLGGATKVLRADPNTPVEKLLSADAINANKFLRGMTARDLELWAAKKMQGPAMTAQNAQPQGRTQVADASGNLPPSANAGTPAPQTAPQTTQPSGGTPQAAAQPIAQPQPLPPPAQPQLAPQARPQQPLVPQEPLPPGYTDPMKAVADLRAAADRLAANQHPGAKEQARRLDDKADRIEAGLKPVSVGTNTSLVDPRTGQPVFEGPGAAAIRGGGGETGPTLDADANTYRQTGKLPPNMGRGVQGTAQATAIRTRAAEQEINEGGDPNDWSTRWQKFGAQTAGRRTLETRAAGLELAENEATTLLPRVRDASAKVSRTQYPSINSLIEAAQKGTGGTDVIKLGIAVESLVPVYARVLKPTGQIAQGDMARAHDILDKAWSDGQIGAALDQMQVELKSARSALDKTLDEFATKPKSGDQNRSGAPSSGKVVKWERGPDGVPRPAP
jgi:muramidase (phage lysozyme)